MRAVLRDLTIGARMALAGGRAGLTRAAMTAVGVGLGVALLLVAASIPAILQSRHARAEARDYVYIGGPKLTASATTMLVARGDTTYRGSPVRGLLLRPEGPRAPRPPGVAALPGPGEMVVSPKLRHLLSTSDGALLRPRLDYRIAGTIGDAGLSGPEEYAYYAFDDHLTAGGEVVRVDHFGDRSTQEGLDPVLLLLTVIAFVVLLLPVAVFTAAAVRFGGERRDRRLAAVRLVGADARAARRIGAGEAFVSAVLGTVLGAVFFLAGRQFVPHVTVFDTSVFAADLRPSPGFAVLVAVAVPASAVAVTLLALRRVVIEPLGVVRRAAGVRRRLWWRLVLPAVGLAMLYPLFGGVHASGRGANSYQVGAGATLMLVGVAALLPWLVESVVRRLNGIGTVSWQLAVRRMQLDSAPSARVVSGIAVAAAGTIGLQMMFGGVQPAYAKTTGQDPGRAQVLVTLWNATGPAADAFASRFRDTPGVLSATAYTEYYRDDDASLLVADCAALRELADVGACADGDAFTVPGDGPQWTISARPRPATPRTDATGSVHSGLLVTPKVARSLTLPEGRVQAFLRLDPAHPDAEERVRNTAARLDPLTDVMVLQSTVESPKFVEVRRGLFVGLVATLLLIGASLLVSTVEQLHERRRLLAVLVAFGTRRGTLAWSVLWQTAVPVLLGLVLAAVAGTGLGAALLTMVSLPVRPNWPALAGICGTGAGVVLLVTALSLPVLWRLMRPDGLRTE